MAALERELDFHETNLDGENGRGEEGGGGGGGGEGRQTDGQTDVERGRTKFESLWHEDGTLTSI